MALGKVYLYMTGDNCYICMMCGKAYLYGSWQGIPVYGWSIILYDW